MTCAPDDLNDCITICHETSSVFCLAHIFSNVISMSFTFRASLRNALPLSSPEHDEAEKVRVGQPFSPFPAPAGQPQVQTLFLLPGFRVASLHPQAELIHLHEVTVSPKNYRPRQAASL